MVAMTKPMTPTNPPLGGCGDLLMPPLLQSFELQAQAMPSSPNTFTAAHSFNFK